MSGFLLKQTVPFESTFSGCKLRQAAICLRHCSARVMEGRHCSAREFNGAIGG
jgi:hypothetical protein